MIDLEYVANQDSVTQEVVQELISEIIELRARLSKYVRPEIDRFTDLYVVDDNGCWLWTGTQSNGYGKFNIRGDKRGAHRWSYEHYVGPIPSGLHIDHLCKVTHCVNPEHLEAVTPRENYLRGEGPSAKNATKTHCKYGHEFTEENTAVYYGRRHCRACNRRRQSEYRQSRKDT